MSEPDKIKNYEASNPKTLPNRLRERADEIDNSVSRTKADRDGGVWGEIELMREAAKEIGRLQKLEAAWMRGDLKSI